jgi:hypothetical protein
MYKKLLNKLLLEYFAPPLDLPPDNQESRDRFHRLMVSIKSSVDEIEDNNCKIKEKPNQKK